MLLGIVLILELSVTAFAALPGGTGVVTSSSRVSGSEFTAKSSIANKLDSMFAGNIGLYADKDKTKLVNAALGTRNVPNNGKYQYWAKGHAGTSCFAYANAFYSTFYDGFSPHDKLNGNHQKVKASGKITYQNFVKWGVRDDAAVYIREGNHSVIVLHYDANYITYIDGNGDGKGLIAIRREAWKRGSGSNIYNSKPTLIVQPKTGYFASGSMGLEKAKPCTEGGSYHSWDAGQVTVSPTCKEEGQKLFTCTACQKQRTETLKKEKEHTYGSWSVTLEPACEKKGTRARKCQLCGKEATEKLKALGHDYGKAVSVQKPTVYAPGITEKTCSRCGKAVRQEQPCSTKNKELGITLETQKGVFPEGSEVDIVSITPEHPLYPRLQSAQWDISGRIFGFSLEGNLADAPVQLEGPVTLTLHIPQNFTGDLELLQLAQEGADPVEYTLSEDGKSLTATLNTLGSFLLCDMAVPAEPMPTEETLPTEPDMEETAPLEPEPIPAPTAVVSWDVWCGVAAVLFRMIIFLLRPL